MTVNRGSWGAWLLMVIVATTFFQPQIRTPGLARPHVSKKTTEHGIFEIVMVTKYLGYLGVLIIASLSITRHQSYVVSIFLEACFSLLIRISIFALFKNMGNFHPFLKQIELSCRVYHTHNWFFAPWQLFCVSDWLPPLHRCLASFCQDRKFLESKNGVVLTFIFLSFLMAVQPLEWG